MSQTVVGKEEVSIFTWSKTSTGKLTTGTATAYILRREDGSDDVEYLQADETTWGGTRHDFSLQTGADLGDADLEQDAWYLFWEVPDSADGGNIMVVASHDDHPVSQTDGPYYVTENDSDDVKGDDNPRLVAGP